MLLAEVGLNADSFRPSSSQTQAKIDAILKTNNVPHSDEEAVPGSSVSVIVRGDDSVL